MTDDSRSMQEKITDALSDAIGSEGEFITKYVCLIEVIDSDGDHALWAMAASDMNSWDVLGLLTWGIQHEQTNKIMRTIAEAAEDD